MSMSLSTSIVNLYGVESRSISTSHNSWEIHTPQCRCTVFTTIRCHCHSPEWSSGAVHVFRCGRVCNSQRWMQLSRHLQQQRRQLRLQLLDRLPWRRIHLLR